MVNSSLEPLNCTVFGYFKLLYIYFFHTLSSNLYFLFQAIFPLLVYPFYFLNILELGMVELDLPVYFLCPLILIFSSSQGQTLSD